MTARFSLIINAGGKSRRMGQPKALLPVPPRGKPLLQTIVERLQPLQPQTTIVVANDPALCQAVALPKRVRWVADHFGEVGPLGGMATGLAEITGWGLVVACDMPWLNPVLCDQLFSLALEENEEGQRQWDAVVPVVNGYVEPMHALYHQRCLPAMESALAAGKRRANAFLPDIRVRYVDEAWLRHYDPELRSFANINTPEEWHALRDRFSDSV
ncbi:MAG: molybdenum cofactor guanylyltransferase [Caldilineaceae bacterium]